MIQRRDIKSMDIAELREALKALSLPAFHAAQIFRWLHQGVTSFDEMTDLSKANRAKLAEVFEISVPSIVRRQESSDGTVKYLWQLSDGNCIECVFMRYHHGNSLCISTQAGCRMGCVFCASTKLGLSRNLTPGEMLDEIIFTQKDTGLRVDSLVLMGTGEPLDNYDNTLKFLRLVSCEGGLNLGQRHISLSTCGLVPRIRDLAEEDLGITLSVSLHSPEDEVRDVLMPVNRAWPLRELIPACRDYFEKTGRRISFEYAMISGKNDSRETAEKLSRLLRGLHAHVNLILLNRVKESPLLPSGDAAVREFTEHLRSRGINVTVRRRMGRDIDAACGQLRASHLTKEVTGEEELP